MFLTIFYTFAAVVFTFTIVSEVKDAKKYRSRLNYKKESN